jgi:hypothetical protein
MIFSSLFYFFGVRSFDPHNHSITTSSPRIHRHFILIDHFCLVPYLHSQPIYCLPDSKPRTMSSNDDDDSCGGFFVEPPDDAEPRPSADDIEANGGQMGIMMRFNSSRVSGSDSGSGMTPEKVLSIIQSRRREAQKPAKSIMTIRIQLNALHPPIWRRVKCPAP